MKHDKSQDKKNQIIMYAICIFIALAAVASVVMTTGITGDAGEEQEMKGAEVDLTNLTANTPGSEEVVDEEAGDSVNPEEIIAIDLITMEQDIQDPSPLAYEYQIMPTYYLGQNDDGDYTFVGTISELDKTNYLGIMFSEANEESENGYKAWLYSGMKFELFSGRESAEYYNFSFSVPPEDIPEGKTVIITGPEQYLI